MADNPQTRAIHEQGLKHKDNVARREWCLTWNYRVAYAQLVTSLRELREKSKEEQRKKEYTEKSLKSIEEAASRKYEEDRKALETSKGSWIFQKDSGYFYNAMIRWYYDEKSGMYYGGDPPDWTSSPPIPSSSLFGAGESKEVGREEAIETAVENKGFRKYPKGMKVKHSHPLAGIGGYQMPTTGSFGGATGIVADSKQETKTLGKRKGAGKTERSEKDAKMSKQEKEALERREAARKRVQERTMQAFGLK
eukprot:jgi/Picsp_1/390/NSC_00388-R1_ww domain-binding protein